MNFVSPFLLAGAGLVAVPIVLHLVMRRKPRRAEFPALRFVRRRHDTNQRQLRLRHLLLLLLRMAVIALAAFALARPSLRLSGGVVGSQRAPVAAALVFDTSKRMEYRQENRTRVEAAQELGTWLLSQLPPESRIAVLDSQPGGGAFQVDLGAAKQRIERLDTTANAQSVPSAVAEAARLLGEEDPAHKEIKRKEIYVFTDLTRVAWPTEAAGRMQEQLRQTPDVGVYVIDVGIPQPANLALGDLRLSGQTVSNRSTLRIETELASTGIAGQRTVELDLLEPAPGAAGERKARNAGQQVVSVEPGQSQPVEFRASGLSLGTHQGYVRILGEDGLAADDRRYFTIEVKPPWPILLAAPKPAAAHAVYLGEALAPESFRRSSQARFACDIVALEELPAKDLKPYAAVCLLDPKPLEAGTWRKLADYVAEGHGLAVFLGRNADPVASFNEKTAQDLLAGKLLRQARSPDESLRLDPRNLEHPVLAAFRRVAAVPWVAHPVYRYWQISPGAEGVHEIAPYSDGLPAILERPLGKGRTITMTTPVSDDPNREPWNLLPVGPDGGWPFMILVNGMMSYLVGTGSQELNYSPGQTAVLQLDPELKFHTYLLTGPDGVEARIAPDLKLHRLVVGSTDQPGNYRVQAGGSEGGVDRGFSVNLAAVETRLDRHADKDLDRLFGTYPYRIARNKEEIEIDVSTGRVGRELFGMLILLTALILGLEHVLANRFYRKG